MRGSRLRIRMLYHDAIEIVPDRASFAIIGPTLLTESCCPTNAFNLGKIENLKNSPFSSTIATSVSFACQRGE